LIKPTICKQYGQHPAMLGGYIGSASDNPIHSATYNGNSVRDGELK